MNPLKLGTFAVRPRLTEIRQARGITQAELAALTGVPQGSISRFDKNNRHESAHVLAIMAALNVSYADLFEILPITAPEPPAE